MYFSTDAYERESKDHDFLNLFARGMVTYFHKKHSIPVYPARIVSYVEGGVPGGNVRILHCHYGDMLHNLDWEIMGRFGNQFAYEFRKKLGRGGQIDWTWPTGDASEWLLTGFDTFS